MLARSSVAAASLLAGAQAVSLESPHALERRTAVLITPASRRRDVDGLRIDVAPDRDVVHVAPVGEIDLATVGRLDEQLRELREAGFRRLVLDLRDVGFMDSTGLRLILTLDALAREDGTDFGLVGGPPPVQRVFEISGTLDRLPFRSA